MNTINRVIDAICGPIDRAADAYEAWMGTNPHSLFVIRCTAEVIAVALSLAAIGRWLFI